MFFPVLRDQHSESSPKKQKQLLWSLGYVSLMDVGALFLLMTLCVLHTLSFRNRTKAFFFPAITHCNGVIWQITLSSNTFEKICKVLFESSVSKIRRLIWQVS